MEAEEKHSEFIRLVGRHLSGEQNPEEHRRFREMLREDPGREELLEACRRIWDSAVQDPGYDLDAEWALMQEKLPGFRTETARVKHAGAGRRLSYYVYRIAAVLVLGAMLTFSWFYVTRVMGTVRVLAREEAVELILEDGTKVTINRNSSLRYSKNFDQEERKVYLSGEAWFDVARDTALPFVIDAGAALVEVLGTRFNVNAYRDNPSVEITVESGLVALSGKEDRENLIVMKAGSGGSYNKSRRSLELIPSSDPNSISWKTRELIFDATPLQEVAEVISKVYGVHIVIMNEELAGCPITVTFREQTLDAVLKVLELTLDLELTRNGNTIRMNGEGCTE